MTDRPQTSDPIFLSSTRELRWILVAWLVCFLWTIGYCWRFGYHTEGSALKTVIGMPSWVFWGVFIPWMVASAVSIWFALTQMEDHPLDDEEIEDGAGDA